MKTFATSKRRKRPERTVFYGTKGARNNRPAYACQCAGDIIMMDCIILRSWNVFRPTKVHRILNEPKDLRIKASGKMMKRNISLSLSLYLVPFWFIVLMLYLLIFAVSLTGCSGATSKLRSKRNWQIFINILWSPYLQQGTLWHIRMKGCKP